MVFEQKSTPHFISSTGQTADYWAQKNKIIRTTDFALLGREGLSWTTHYLLPSWQPDINDYKTQGRP